MNPVIKSVALSTAGAVTMVLLFGVAQSRAGDIIIFNGPSNGPSAPAPAPPPPPSYPLPSPTPQSACWVGQVAQGYGQQPFLLNVRTGPSTNYPPTVALPVGWLVKICSPGAGNWVQIEACVSPYGEAPSVPCQGWVSANFVAFVRQL